MKKIFSALLLIFILAATLTSCDFTVPRPEIKTGEFDFTVTYELGGETKTISGVYVCEYNGTNWTLDGGYHRDWKGYIKGGELDTLIYLGTADDGGVIELHLAFYPEYFMGDSDFRGVPTPWISVTHTDGKWMSVDNEADVVEQRYGAKLISYKYAEPIKNSFGLFK